MQKNKIKIFIFLLFACFLFTDRPALANPAGAINDKNPFGNMQVEIPGLKELVQSNPVTCDEKGECKIPWISVYIAAIYNYAIGIVAIVATVIMMFGGFSWIMAGGNAERIGDAKAWITASLAGLVLTMGSYFILYQINPDLTNLKPIEIQTIVGKSSPVAKNNICKLTKEDDCTSFGGNWKKQVHYFCLADVSKDSAPSFTCCCPPLGGDWEFDNSKIKSQMSNADPELKELLSCLRQNLPVGVGRISSISDEAGLAECRDNWTDEKCAHKKNSCHYSGGTPNGLSMAVDIGDEENFLIIRDAHNACKKNKDFFLEEDTHVHISTAGCPRDF